MEPPMLKILWEGLLAFLAASARLILRGPSSPGWSWRLEWIVAVQRAVLGAMNDWPPPRIRKVMIGRVGPLARGLDRAPEELGGIPCERSTLPGSAPESHLLYLHGGGFTLGSIASHREVVSSLTTYGHLCAHSVAYRQPPEDKFPTAVEDVVAAYRELLDSGVHQRNHEPDPTMKEGS
jgi:acetyl esterase/lipase